LDLKELPGTFRIAHLDLKEHPGTFRTAHLDLKELPGTFRSPKALSLDHTRFRKIEDCNEHVRRIKKYFLDKHFFDF
jgi:hypothetical protein